MTPDSFAMWRLPVLRQQGRQLRGRACDDLAGVTVALAVLWTICAAVVPRTCAGLLLTRAEETGFGGMMAAVRGDWLPREPLYINIECSSRRAGAELGAGPVIRVGDRISVFDPRLCAGLVAIAEGEMEGFEGPGLPYQRKLMDGGACEATVLALAGFQVGAVALPLDHYHNWGRKRLRPEAIDIGDAVALVEPAGSRCGLPGRSCRQRRGGAAQHRAPAGNPLPEPAAAPGGIPFTPSFGRKTEMMETVALGLSGISTSRLCFGTGTQGWHHRSNQGDLGIERLSYLLRYAHERGITFWDTADMYGTHPHVADALRQVERESVTITTKTVSRTASEVRSDVERFLGRTQAPITSISCCSIA